MRGRDRSIHTGVSGGRIDERSIPQSCFLWGSGVPLTEKGSIDRNLSFPRTNQHYRDR